MANRSIMATLTGDFFQPVRLCYQVLNQPGLERAFGTLGCLKYDAPRNRWVWLYEDEARTLQFQRSYVEFPKELRPIVIGTFFMRAEDTLLLDLRSCERALVAIPFFDKHLTRKLVNLKDAEIVNQLFPLTKENQQLTPDSLFDAQVSTLNDPEALLQELKGKALAEPNPLARLKILMAGLEAALKRSAAADRTVSCPLRRGWDRRLQAGVATSPDRRRAALAGQLQVYLG